MLRFAIALALLLPLGGMPVAPGAAAAEAPPGPSGDPGAHVPVTDELAVLPPPWGWTSDNTGPLSVRILDDTFHPDLEVSRVRLDGRRLIPDWDPEARILLGLVGTPISEGPHGADVTLVDALGRILAADWSFSVDTVLPVVDFDPLPPVADARVYTVTGTVRDPNLERFDVNGFGAILEGDRFTVPVLLWPGRTDLVARAVDRASNLGIGEGTILWYPPAVAVRYERFETPDGGFATHLPADWIVEAGAELEADLRADVQAVEPTGASARSTVAVVSRGAGAAMTPGLLLTVLNQALYDLGVDGNVRTIGAPRMLEGTNASAAAQFSALETLQTGERVFRHVTGFWSRSLERIWLVVGSMTADRVERDWHALQMAVESFEPLEPAPPGPPVDGPRAGVARATYVTVAAIAFVVSLFAVVLWSRWQGSRADYRRSRRT